MLSKPPRCEQPEAARPARHKVSGGSRYGSAVGCLARALKAWHKDSFWDQHRLRLRLHAKLVQRCCRCYVDALEWQQSLRACGSSEAQQS